MLLSHPGPFPSHRARIGSHRHGGHTVITVAVSVLLVVINVTLAPELPWSAFAVAGMVIGLAAHWWFGYRRLDDQLARQQKFTQARAATHH